MGSSSSLTLNRIGSHGNRTGSCLLAIEIHNALTPASKAAFHRDVDREHLGHRFPDMQSLGWNRPIVAKDVAKKSPQVSPPGTAGGRRRDPDQPVQLTLPARRLTDSDRRSTGQRRRVYARRCCRMATRRAALPVQAGVISTKIMKPPSLPALQLNSPTSTNLKPA